MGTLFSLLKLLAPKVQKARVKPWLSHFLLPSQLSLTRPESFEIEHHPSPKGILEGQMEERQGIKRVTALEFIFKTVCGSTVPSPNKTLLAGQAQSYGYLLAAKLKEDMPSDEDAGNGAPKALYQLMSPQPIETGSAPLLLRQRLYYHCR